tara:strand:+ start:703 stop:876 length:174 start_codon:yes stop_codon:yes gene_type:complete
MTTQIVITIPDKHFNGNVEKLLDGWQSELGEICDGEDDWSQSQWGTRVVNQKEGVIK